MQPVDRLPRLTRLAHKRLIYLSGLVQTIPILDWQEADRILSFAAIETLNLWSEFIRSYYLSCIFGAEKGDGTKVKTAVRVGRTVATAIDFSVRKLRPSLRHRPPWRRRDEPTWYEPETLIVLSRELGCSNFKEITAAFSYPTRAFADLPKFRNFFAHRNEETARKAVERAIFYGLSPKLRPGEILASIAPGRPQSVLDDWIDDLREIAALLCC